MPFTLKLTPLGALDLMSRLAALQVNHQSWSSDLVATDLRIHGRSLYSGAVESDISECRLLQGGACRHTSFEGLAMSENAGTAMVNSEMLKYDESISL